MGAKKGESSCSKKLTASNATGSVNTEKHPLDICVSDFSGMVGTEATNRESKSEWVVGRWSLGMLTVQGKKINKLK